MGNDNIFKKIECEVCKHVTMAKLISIGKYGELNFEGDDLVRVSVNSKSWKVCPTCAKRILAEIENLGYMSRCKAVKNAGGEAAL